MEAKIKINKLISGHAGDKNATIECLQLVNNEFGYIPKEAIREISHVTTVPESEIYGVLTFYSQFSLTPKAKYNIEVCMGTACFVLGGQTMIDVLKSRLKVDVGQVTPDGRFAVHQTRCLGCCGLAPVMSINGEVYGHLTVDKIFDILDKLK